MKQYYMVIDVSLCHDCNNCFLACKDEHVGNQWLPYTEDQPRHGHKWMDILSTERGLFPCIDVCYLPKPCQHCQDAPCIKAYPDCISLREDGIVLIDANKARGVKGLVDSCPYGAIYWNEEANVAQKCTMCAHLLDSEDWKPGVPRCVHSCPTDAMKFYHMEPAEFEMLARKEGFEGYRSDGTQEQAAPGSLQEPLQIHQEFHHRRCAGKRGVLRERHGHAEEQDRSPCQPENELLRRVQIRCP